MKLLNLTKAQSNMLLLLCNVMYVCVRQKKLMDVWFMNIQVYKSSRETHDWFNETFIQVVG